MLGYLDAFQVIVVDFVIVGLGYLCGFLKLFNAKQVASIRRVLYLISIPGMMFHQVGMQKMNYDTWSPFIIGILVQVSYHLISLGIIYLIPAESKLKNYLLVLFSTTYTSYLFWGIPIIQVLFGDANVFVAVMLAIVEFFIMIPIHNLISFVPPEKIEQEQQENIDLTDAELEEEKNDDNSQAEDGNPDEIDVVAEEISEISIEDDSPEVLDHIIKENTLGSTALWSFVSPITICIILGIIWACLPWDMPTFLDAFALDLEKTVMATGLFCVGVFMWEHPFGGCKWGEVIVLCLVHYIVLPCLSIFWCWALGISKGIALTTTLTFCMPLGLTGFIQATSSSYGLQSASFTFFYTNLIAVPVLMLWITVLNETKLFQ